MNIKQILKESGKSYTQERKVVFEYIKNQHIFSSSDLENHFSGKIGRASIFRTLNLFLELGVIRKLDFGEKAMSYELNDHSHHHEHMKCRKCDSVINFESANICNRIFKEAKKIGFEITSHNIGIVGTCKTCLDA